MYLIPHPELWEDMSRVRLRPRFKSYSWCPSMSVNLLHIAVPTALPNCTMGTLIPMS